MAAGLAAAGVCVVSGAALGVDAAAHLGALDVDGTTVAVLGSGIDVPYPKTNRGLLERIAGAGAVLSEHGPGIRPDGFRFPGRNRIVAGLSRAVVVVEGAEVSGALITADHALNVGRDVCAVPGAVTNPMSAAPHKLLRDGAALVTCADDVMHVLGMHPASERWTVPTLSDVERTVWDGLQGPTPADLVAASTGLSLPDVLAALVGLELRGVVFSAGGRYERMPGAVGSP
jgi:DNA processing protein